MLDEPESFFGRTTFYDQERRADSENLGALLQTRSFTNAKNLYWLLTQKRFLQSMLSTLSDRLLGRIDAVYDQIGTVQVNIYLHDRWLVVRYAHELLLATALVDSVDDLDDAAVRLLKLEADTVRVWESREACSAQLKRIAFFRAIY